MKKILIAIGALIALSATASELDKVKMDLANALPNTPVDEIANSEIPGLYRVISGANVFYYNVEKRLMVFGEVLTTDGQNLTFSHRQRARTTSIESSKDSALTLTSGDPINVVYEFSNPDCGACRHYEKYLSRKPYENTVRHIFFLGWSESSRQKIEHIMCSEDKEAAMHAIYRGADVTEFATCEQGKTQAQRHREVAKALGVDRTPTLIVNGTRVVGHQPQAISKLMKSETKDESSKSLQSD